MRLLPALALSAALFTGACTYPDGSVDMGSTLALGAGVAIAGLAIAAASDDRPRYSNRGYYGRPSYGYGHHRGYNRGYRRW